jgi:hypothetical protein
MKYDVTWMNWMGDRSIKRFDVESVDEIYSWCEKCPVINREWRKWLVIIEVDAQKTLDLPGGVK